MLDMPDLVNHQAGIVRKTLVSAKTVLDEPAQDFASF
jgi:hypothetical protein